MADEAATTQATQDAAQATAQTNEAQASATAQAGKTFTQVELDQIVQDRLGRERAKHADYDDLRKAAAELKTLKASQMSETEKTQARLAELEKAQTSWQQERRDLVLRHSFTQAAATSGALYPDSVYKLADLGQVEFDDSGQPKNLEAVVKALKAQYPALFRPAGGGSVDAASGNRSPVSQGMNSFIRRSAGRG